MVVLLRPSAAPLPRRTAGDHEGAVGVRDAVQPVLHRVISSRSPWPIVSPMLHARDTQALGDSAEVLVAGCAAHLTPEGGEPETQTICRCSRQRGLRSRAR